MVLRKREICLVVALSAALVCIYGYVQREIKAVKRSVCTGNLKQIGFALHTYHETYGSFPPAYIADSEGRPAHSWRILVAKHREPERFDTYRFEESWDSPHNLQVAKQFPQYFHCPKDTDGHSKGQTSYVAVLGKDTVFPFAEAAKLEDVNDDHGTTLLVVEAVGTGIFWTEPRDLLFSEMNFQIQQDKKGLSSNHFNGPGIVTVNGLTKRIPPSTSAEQLKSMLTISGNEKVTVDF